MFKRRIIISTNFTISIVTYAPEQLSGSSLGSSPNDNSSDGIKLDENEVWQFRFAYGNTWQGMVLTICPYLDRYFLASASNTVIHETCPFCPFILSLPHCHPILSQEFLFIQLYLQRLEQLYSDPLLRLVADCILMDAETAVGCCFGS
ncbi:hypothetical protein Ahy_B09g098761 [Arachis hypogaea]|uniref:Uncharacterized protein n=1 Tax=Arachis hypogaea TaxID=3818 RepID=A0A444XS60_ARAHY|nr:hypothetical protein Ahy_B09g098761 [Arachis hypogaea]